MPDPAHSAANAETLPPRPDAPMPPVPPTRDEREHADASLPAERVRVAGYEVLSVLGRGGMGVVYKARQTKLDRLVALKMILSGAHAGPDELLRFRQEAEALGQLQHPNIVQVYDVGAQDGLPYLALELVEGGSLADRLDGTPWPAASASELVEVLARAIHAAHERGVIHRDLKPANVLVRISDFRFQISDFKSAISNLQSEIKITDFGLAKRLPSEQARTVPGGPTQSGAIVGTPSYMAPEQAGGARDVIGPAVDQYALGAILYELVTGRPPFRAPTPMDTVLQVLSEEPVPPRRLQPQLPRDLETICLKCLQKEPGKRYPNALALAEDLRRFREGLPIAARPIGPAERGLKWARRRPAVAALLLALLLVGAAGFGGMAGLWLRAEEQRGLADRARSEAEQAAQNARQSAEVAHQQQQRAEASYRLARKALEKALRLEKDPRFQQGELEDVRRQLLQAAVSFYQEFVQLQGDDPQFERERAAAFFELGQASEALGSRQEALRAYQQALAIYDRQAQARPGDVEYRLGQAEAHNNLGIVYDRLGRTGEAEKAYLRARDLWQGLARQAPAFSYYKDRQAGALHNLSILYRHTSRPREAEDFLRQALVLREALVRAEPNNDDYAVELAYSRFNQGVLYCTSNRPQEAERALVQARDLYEKLVQKQPHDTDRLAGLAKAHNSLGVLYMDTGRPKEAEKALRAALTIKERLVNEHPAVAEHLTDLSTSYNNLGMLYYHTGRLAESTAVQQKALALEEKLVARNPGDIQLAVSLGGSCCNLGLALREQKRPADALVWFGKAVDTLRKALQQEPHYARGRDFLCKSYAGRAETFEVLKRSPDALADWEQALKYAAEDERPGLRLRRALALARTGQYAEATKAADALARLPNLPGPVLYDLACVYALCARDKEHADQNAGRTLALLRQVEATGFFRPAARRQHFQTDADFGALRERADFKQFVQSLVRKAG